MTGEIIPSETARMVFHNLVVAVQMDRKVTVEEELFLEQVRKQLGLDESFTKDIILRASTEPLQLQVPEGPHLKQSCFHFMIKACLCDGELHERERAMLMGIGAHFGYSEEDLANELKSALD